MKKAFETFGSHQQGIDEPSAGPLTTPSCSVCRSGFTIAELLIALLLLAFVLAGLLTLTRSTLRLTGTSVAVSSSITDVSQAEAYVSDLFRVSKAVYGTIDVERGSGDIVPCRLEGSTDPSDPVAAGRCIALLIPVVEDDGEVQRIINYDLSVISVEPIGDRFDAVGVGRGFDGVNTLALFEYRAFGLCTPEGGAAIDPCIPGVLGLEDGSTRPVIDSEGLLLVGISPVNAAGTVAPTFRLAGDDVASRTLLMRFIVRAHGPTGSPFAVRESAVALEVAVRGLAAAATE